MDVTITIFKVHVFIIVFTSTGRLTLSTRDWAVKAAHRSSCTALLYCLETLIRFQN